MTRRQSSGGYSQVLWFGPAMPALATRMSIPPNALHGLRRRGIDPADVRDVDGLRDTTSAPSRRELGRRPQLAFIQRRIDVPQRHARA